MTIDGPSAIRGFVGRARQVALGAALIALLAPATPAWAAAPGAPTLLEPAAGHVFSLTEAQRFTVRATDPDGDRWLGVVEVTNLDNGRTTTFAAGPADSGDEGRGFATPPLVKGRYRWRAHAVDTNGEAGPWSSTVEFRVGVNQPPGAPVLLAPADGAYVRRGAGEPFAISAVDPDGDPYSGTVVVTRRSDGDVTSFSTSLAPSGRVSIGVFPGILEEGTYDWTATAHDLEGASSLPSSSRAFTVGPPTSAGAAAVTGTVTYAPGLPPGLCQGTTATYSLDAATAVVNSAVVGYVGPVTIEGTTTSSCESLDFGTSPISLDMQGESANDSTLACTDLEGTVTRVALSVAMSLSGGCVINGFVVSQVTFVATLQLVPTDVSTQVAHTQAVGTFLVQPE